MGLWSWLSGKQGQPDAQRPRLTSRNKPIFEPLEIRILLDANPIGLIQPTNNPYLDDAAPQAVVVDSITRLGAQSDSQTVGQSGSQTVPEELVFVDGSLDYSAFSQLEPNEDFGVIQLDPNQDGIEQIADILTQYQDLNAIHIISHGAPGKVFLGASILNQSTLPDYSSDLEVWGHALANHGDILLYGCSIASGPENESFIQGISEITHADVACSNDPTGPSDVGSDWDLEIATGIIEAKPFDIEPLIETVLDGANSSNATVNQAPAIILYGLSPDPVEQGGIVTLQVFFSDLDVYDEHTASVEWGDGVTDTFVLPVGDRHFKPTHTYYGGVTDTITIAVADDAGGSHSYSLPTDTVENFPPTDIVLDSTSVLEHQAIGTLVGTFISDDPDSNDTHTYSLVAGVGDTNNASFTINGNRLLTAQVFNRDIKDAYTIRVRSTDNHGGNYEEVFVVTIDSDFNDHGNNAASSTAIAVPSSTLGNIEVGADVDWFRFTATAGTEYAFETLLDSLQDSQLRLYDTDGVTQLQFNDDGGAGLASKIVWTAPSDGVYYLEVRPDGVWTGTYRLAASQTNNFNTLSLTIDPAIINENGGTATATVYRNGSTTGNLTVTLQSNDTSEATVPSTVIIPDGVFSAVFTLTAVDDALLDGTQTVTITASANGYFSGTATLQVLDDEGDDHGNNAASSTAIAVPSST
ncbi:DUF4347 domain-containing protein, partial [Planctomycetota bacterium]